MGHDILDITEHHPASGVFVARPKCGVTKIVTEADVMHVSGKPKGCLAVIVAITWYTPDGLRDSGCPVSA